jgi:hypothetical protein
VSSGKPSRRFIGEPFGQAAEEAYASGRDFD